MMVQTLAPRLIRSNVNVIDPCLAKSIGFECSLILNND